MTSATIELLTSFDRQSPLNLLQILLIISVAKYTKPPLILITNTRRIKLISMTCENCTSPHQIKSELFDKNHSLSCHYLPLIKPKPRLCKQTLLHSKIKTPLLCSQLQIYMLNLIYIACYFSVPLLRDQRLQLMRILISLHHLFVVEFLVSSERSQ